MNKLDWIKHFVDAHKRRNDPSAEEMLAYPKAFFQVFEEHQQLHLRFYTGHEHLPDGTSVPGRTK